MNMLPSPHSLQTVLYSKTKILWKYTVGVLPYMKVPNYRWMPCSRPNQDTHTHTHTHTHNNQWSFLLIKLWSLQSQKDYSRYNHSLTVCPWSSHGSGVGVGYMLYTRTTWSVPPVTKKCPPNIKIKILSKSAPYNTLVIFYTIIIKSVEKWAMQLQYVPGLHAEQTVWSPTLVFSIILIGNLLQ